MEILRLSDVNTLIRAAWAYAAEGAELPELAMKPGGTGPALLWDNGAYLYLDAFGIPIVSGAPPVTPPPIDPPPLASGLDIVAV